MTAGNGSKTAQRLRELVTGGTEPPNDFVAYHVKMVRAAQTEHDALLQAIAKGTQQLAALKQRALALRAHLEAHLQTIAAWDPESHAERPSGGAAL
jgi:hypothetical protein